MDMTLEEIYKMLAKVEGGADAVASIKAEITNLRNEAKANRIDKEGVEKMLKDIGIGTDEKGKEQAESIKKLMEQLTAQHKSPTEVVPHLTELEKAVKDLTEKYNKAEEKANAAEAKRIASVTNAELIKALTDAKAVSPSQIAKILAGNVKAKDDGSLSYLMDDGKTEKSIKDGVAAYLKANPVFVSNGAGAGAGSVPPTGTEKDVMSKQMDDIMKTV